MGISYKLDNFEGPLDLLLHLIEKNKVSICDIPIVLITEQYLDYVSRLETEDMGIMSEFLVMASALLDIKSRMLLPSVEEEPEEEDDPRAELAARLLEYRMYRKLAANLEEMEEAAPRHLYKEPAVPDEVAKYEPPADLDRLLDGLTEAKLREIFDSVMRRQKERVDPIHSRFGTITRETVSLEKKIGSVMDYARKKRRFRFRQMFSGGTSRVEVVVTFLAVLELTRTGRIRLTQENLSDDMDIEVTEKGKKPEEWGTDGINLEGLEDF